MNAIDRYKRLLADVFEARSSGDEAAEDRLLDDMDLLWHELGDDGRAAINRLSARIASGELPEEEFVREIRGRVNQPVD